MRTLLQSFDERIVPLSDEEYMQFYLQEIKVYKTTNTKRPDKEEDIIDYRRAFLLYPRWENFFSSVVADSITGDYLKLYKSHLFNSLAIFHNKECLTKAQEKLNKIYNYYLKIPDTSPVMSQDSSNELSEFTVDDRHRIRFESKLAFLGLKTAYNDMTTHKSKNS